MSFNLTFKIDLDLHTLDKYDESHVFLMQYMLRDALTDLDVNALNSLLYSCSNEEDQPFIYLYLIKRKPFEDKKGVWALQFSPFKLQENIAAYDYRAVVSIEVKNLLILVNDPAFRRRVIYQLLPSKPIINICDSNYRADKADLN